MTDCGCSPTWLIEYAAESDGAWDRRVTGIPIVGDIHPSQDAPVSAIHSFNGFRWLTIRRAPNHLMG